MINARFQPDRRILYLYYTQSIGCIYYTYSSPVANERSRLLLVRQPRRCNNTLLCLPHAHKLDDVSPVVLVNAVLKYIWRLRVTIGKLLSLYSE